MANVKNINRLIDYIRDPKDSYAEYLKKAKNYNFRCIFANRFQFEEASNYLRGTDVIVAGYCDFPLGEECIEAQLADFQDQYRIGFREIEGILNQYAVENRIYDYIERQIAEISIFCKERDINTKIILETCKMDEECLRRVCEIALKYKPTCLKTSTGKGLKGAELDKVKLMKSILKDQVQIKAAGGIHTYKEACEFINAGAEVLGSSAGIEIYNQEKNII